MRRTPVGHAGSRLWPTWAPSVAAILLVTVGVQSRAGADNSDFIDPDNVDHYVDRNSLTSNGDAATQRGIDQLNRTKMNATLTGSGDVEVFDDYYGTSGSWTDVRGRATCVNKTWTGLECDVYEVKYNQSYLQSQSLPNWLHVGCHEFGHTGGIWHRSSSDDSNNNSCMRSGGTNAELDDHDISVINDDV